MDNRRRMLFKKKFGSGSIAIPGSYSIDFNNQWDETSEIPNPDPTLYDGVYRSVSNYNVGNDSAIMYIHIKNCNYFKMYIRSYAESNYDYVMVSQLDTLIDGNTTYSDTILVKAHTRGNQQSGTSLNDYTLVKFTGIPDGEHFITVVYRKDGSTNMNDDRGYVLIDKLHEREPYVPFTDINNYLTIEALEDGLTAKLSINACEYCVDGDGNWKTLTANTVTESINTGQTLSFRGNLTPASNKGIGRFAISKMCNLKGNCMSMLFGDDAVNNFSLNGKNYAFYRLFYGCARIVNVSEDFLPATTLANYCYDSMFDNCLNLINAPVLPATTLANSCYSGMFHTCLSLINAPVLPATTLAIGCYFSMFSGCIDLTTAPELPVTTLVEDCYAYMFNGCTSLTTAPELPATTLAENCYSDMFSGCTSLTTAPELPATTLAERCYYYMFRDCTSLTTAPELPATTLAESCYYYMFRDCTQLNYIKMLATDISASNCLYNWVKNVASTGTFVKHPDMTSLTTGVSGIPSGWTVVDCTLITFTVGGTEYQAVEGMTWGDWVNSEYNTFGYYIDNNIVRPGTSMEVVDASHTAQYADTIILNNATYRATGGGSSD